MTDIETNVLEEYLDRLRQDWEIEECSECGRQYYDDPEIDREANPLTCDEHPR